MKESYQEPIKGFEASQEAKLEDLYVFGDLVKNAYGIGKMSMDRESLARNLGISMLALQGWENNNAVPKEENLEHVANVLGVSLLSLKEICTKYHKALKLEKEANIDAFKKPKMPKIEKDNEGFFGGGNGHRNNPRGSHL